MREVFVVWYYLFLIFTWIVYTLLTGCQASQLPVIVYIVFLSIRLATAFYKCIPKKFIVILDFTVALYSTFLIVPFFESSDDWLIIWVTSLIFIWIIALSSFCNDSCRFFCKFLFNLGKSHIICANWMLFFYGFLSITYVVVEYFIAGYFNCFVLVMLMPVFWYIVFQIGTRNRITLYNKAILSGITNLFFICCIVTGAFYIWLFSLFLPINMDAFNEKQIISLFFMCSLIAVELIFGVIVNINFRNLSIKEVLRRKIP